VHHYYSYDVSQNGGTLRVIVLDNSNPTGLDASEPGQSAWLSSQLAAARAEGVAVVVFCSQPLDADLPVTASGGPPRDATAVATELVDAGVLAVFSSSQSDTVHMIPYEAPNQSSPGPQIPEYEGASLGYQQTQNDGVLWYFVSVDTATDTVSVQGIPVVQSLALEPLDGLTAARSSTLSFRAVGRRPSGTLPVTIVSNNQQGYANYVQIPASSCGSCVSPSYTFTSSNQAIGNFVVPSGPGSLFPKLSSSGKTTASSTSGLFCAFNAGHTTVSVTSGLLTASLTVTVKPGNIGQPCGTVTYTPGETIDVIKPKPVLSVSVGGNPGAGTVAPAPVVKPVAVSISKIHVIPPPPSPSPSPRPAPVQAAAPAPQRPPAISHPPPVVTQFVAPFLPAPLAFAAVTPVVVPPIPPPITPVPPGGATASAQATAKREEKARKHASQSAYVTRPAGTSAEDWFYPAVAVVTVVSMMLIAGGIRPGPGRAPAFVEIKASDDDPRLRRRRTH
jgi:hypothetical protein